MSNNEFRYKSIRDPLYGFINLSETEVKIIDSPVFRRLQNIKQLSHAYIVYPTAIHTRFEHALGATHLANRVSEEFDFPDEVKKIVRLTALTHDLGHGPFSHLFEDVLKHVLKSKLNHEDISKLIIEHDSDLQSILGVDDSKKIIQLLSENQNVEGWDPSHSSLASDVVDSPLDVDKMDYLRRDSYHIGVAYGQFDLERIIHTIGSTPGSSEKHICIDGKGKDAIENYRLGRYLMHAQVYEHHARKSADQMFLKAMNLAINEENIIKREKFDCDVTSKDSVKEFLKFYTSLDDRSIYNMILDKAPDSETAKILKNIQQRKLLKRVCDFLPDKEVENEIVRRNIMKAEYDQLSTWSDEIADNVGLAHHDVIVYKAEIPVHLFEGQIMINWRGVPRQLDDFSPISADKSSITKFYIFAPENDDIKEKIKNYVIEKLGIPKEIFTF